MKGGDGKVECAGVMIMAMHHVKGAMEMEKAGKGGSGLLWRGTEVKTGTKREEAWGKRAEIPLFERKVKVWPSRKGPGPDEAIEPTLNTAWIQLAQDMEDLHVLESWTLCAAVARTMKLTISVMAAVDASVMAAPECPQFGMSKKLPAALAKRMEAPTQSSSL